MHNFDALAVAGKQSDERVERLQCDSSAHDEAEEGGAAAGGAGLGAREAAAQACATALIPPVSNKGAEGVSRSGVSRSGTPTLPPYMCVLFLRYLCPHTTICVSLYYYVCPDTSIYVSSHARTGQSFKEQERALMKTRALSSVAVAVRSRCD